MKDWTGSPGCCSMCCPCAPVGFGRLVNSVSSAGSALITSKLFSRVILVLIKESALVGKIVAALEIKG